MLTHTDLRKGVEIILDGEPYEVLEANPLKKAQRRPVIQARVKNLITNSVFEKTFHQGDVFKEAELVKIEAKFLYCHRERYFFSEQDNSSKRFDLGSEQIGEQIKFIKPNQILKVLVFNGKIINISLPIKVQLKVAEAPPGTKGNRAQSGTKTVTLETKAQIAVPLFIKEGDVIEINTESGEYTRRVE